MTSSVPAHIAFRAKSRRIRRVSLFLAMSLACWSSSARSDIVVDFEDLTLATASFNNGAGQPNGFVSQTASFNNVFTDFGGGFTAWAGWSYSNITDVVTSGFGNQYSAYHLPAGGGAGSANYGVAFWDTFNDVKPRIDIPSGFSVDSVELTNTTYTALSMRDGDAFSKKFGGTSGADPDFLVVHIHGLDETGAAVAPPVDFYLADYRGPTDTIISNWTTVDLTSLANAQSLVFDFDSSDVGTFGINTPLYLSLDNLRLLSVPEPNAIHLIAIVAPLAMTSALLQRRRRFRSESISRSTRNDRYLSPPTVRATTFSVMPGTSNKADLTGGVGSARLPYGKRLAHPEAIRREVRSL